MILSWAAKKEHESMTPVTTHRNDGPWSMEFYSNKRSASDLGFFSGHLGTSHDTRVVVSHQRREESNGRVLCNSREDNVRPTSSSQIFFTRSSITCGTWNELMILFGVVSESLHRSPFSAVAASVPSAHTMAKKEATIRLTKSRNELSRWWLQCDTRRAHH